MAINLSASAPRRWFQPRPWTRTQKIITVVLFGFCVASYVSLWCMQYRHGYYVIVPNALDACGPIARSFEPDQTGVTWTQRLLSDEERQKSHVAEKPIFFGMLSRWSENGPVEGIGSRDGRRLYRVTVRPGPFSIGWTMASYEDLRISR